MLWDADWGDPLRKRLVGDHPFRSGSSAIVRQEYRQQELPKTIICLGLPNFPELPTLR
jgi:hypothetical protein